MGETKFQEIPGKNARLEVPSINVRYDISRAERTSTDGVGCQERSPPTPNTFRSSPNRNRGEVQQSCNKNDSAIYCLPGQKCAIRVQKIQKLKKNTNSTYRESAILAETSSLTLSS